MSGSQVLSAAEDLSGGIVVCGYRFEDMMYDELRQCLSFNFEMLVLASPARWSGIQMSGVVCLPMPLKVHDLLSTLDMMLQRSSAFAGNCAAGQGSAARKNRI